MSLWTPDGERPVGARRRTGPPSRPRRTSRSFEDLSPEDQARFEAMQAEMEEVRQRSWRPPPRSSIANHAMGIYELAAIHLTAPEPKLPEAVLAIDALAALVDGLGGSARRGGAHPAGGARPAPRRLPRGGQGARASACPATRTTPVRAAGGPPRTTPASWPPSLDADGALRSLNPAGRRLLGLARRRAPPERHRLRPAWPRSTDPCSRSTCCRRSAARGSWSGTLNVVDQPRARRCPTAVHAPLPPRRRHHLDRPGHQHRAGRVRAAPPQGLRGRAAPGSPTARSSSTASTSRCGAPTRARRRSPCCSSASTGSASGATACRPIGATTCLRAVGRAARRPPRPDRQRGAVGRRRVRVPLARATTSTTAPSGSPTRSRVPFPVGGIDVFLTASVGAATGPAGRGDHRPAAPPGRRRQPDGPAARRRRRAAPSTSALQDRARRRAEVEDALRGAAGRGELVLHYQPEVSLRTNRIVAVEALVRWQHPDVGPRGPRRVRAGGRVLEPHPRGGRWVLDTAADAVRRLAGPLRRPHARRSP